MPLQIIQTPEWGSENNSLGPGSDPSEFALVEPRLGSVSVEVLIPGIIFRVHWIDLTLSPPNRRNTRAVPYGWRVIFASEETAGNATGGEQWSRRVMEIGLGLYDVVATGRLSYSYTHTDIVGNGWLVVASVVDGETRNPCQPIYIDMSGSSGILANDVTDPSLDIQRRTANGYQVWRLFPGYTSPTDMTAFWGVQLYLNAFHGVDLEEIADAHKFPTGTGGQPTPPNSWDFDVPAGTDPTASVGNGTATFTNGSKAVVWVSGDHFSGGMATRPIYAKEFTSDGVWTDAMVDTVTDGNNIVLLANFTGVTGTYQYDVLPTLICYFVALNPQGGRTTTPTSSPNRTI
jgi:hypothetical protein